MIQRVQQEDRSGCVLACVAMLSGLSYAEVRSAWVGYSKRREWRLCCLGAGLTAGERNALVIRLGVTIDASRIRIVNVQPGIGGHAVVVDDDGSIIDPESPA